MRYTLLCERAARVWRCGGAEGHAGGLRDCRRRFGGLRSGQPVTEAPSVRVILIEAGGRDWTPLIHIPAGFMKMLDHKTLTWGFRAEAGDGREIIYPRGRVLGG